MESKTTPEEALQKLEKICSRQEKCMADVARLLNRWGVAAAFHSDIIGRLKAGQFLDERRFATAFVQDKILFDHWGMIKIQYFLRQKNIPGRIADEASATVDRKDYIKMIRKELEKRKKTLKGTPFEIRAKLARYGTSRGYEMEYIMDFLNEMEGGD